MSTRKNAVVIATAANFSGLTAGLDCRVDNNDTTITVLQWTATGLVGITHAELTDTTVIGFSGSYPIQ